MKIITISREYGAGGLAIGTAVAEKLGIELYNKAILRATAKASNMDYAQVEKEGESITKGESFLRSITPISYEQKEYLFSIQSEYILEVAGQGPCVILGRCGNWILEEAGIDALDVFIYSDPVHRAHTIGEYLNTTSADEIARVMKKNDHDRRAFYEHFTGQKWGDCHNYNMSLDSGLLGYDKCVELICAAAQN